MRAEVAECAHAGDLWIGHAAPFLVEPAAEGTAMAIRAPRAGYLAKIALGNLVLEEKVHRVRSHEIAGREEQIRFFDRVRHRVALLRGDAQWLFCEHVFA